MPMWAVMLTVIFSAIIMFVSVASFLRSFRFATKDDINELKEEIRNINQRIDRHLEGHS